MNLQLSGNLKGIIQVGDSTVYCLHTFVAVSESPFLSSLNVSYPQVVIVDEGYEVGVPRADFGVHAGP